MGVSTITNEPYSLFRVQKVSAVIMGPVHISYIVLKSFLFQRGIVFCLDYLQRSVKILVGWPADCCPIRSCSSHWHPGR